MQYNLNWLIDKPIAHRGLHNNNGVPENSLTAFKKAMEFGLPVELDLKLTSDENLIVFHDEDFFRMTGNKNIVAQTKLSEIKSYFLKGTDEKIPLFTDLLEFIDGKIPLLIEVKNFNKPGIFEEKLMDALQDYSGEYAVQSFNPLTVRWFKLNYPGVIRGQISSSFKEFPVPLHYKYILRNLTLNFTSKPHFINYNIDDLPSLPVELYRNYGLPIIAWTVRNIDQLKKAKDLCDNFVFENIDPSELN